MFMKMEEIIMEMNQELFEKAKTAKSAEELLALAKENEVEMTEERAKAYYELMQSQIKTGELSDEELDNVSGGGCHKDDGRLVVTAFDSCNNWRCEEHPESGVNGYCSDVLCSNGLYSRYHGCANCHFSVYESALLLCNHSANRR